MNLLIILVLLCGVSGCAMAGEGRGTAGKAATKPATQPSTQPTTQSLIPPVPEADQILKTLNPAHPRLIVTADDFKRIATHYRHSEKFRAVADKLIANADKIVDEPPSKYEIPDGKRLLATSRRVLDRVQKLAVAYHLTHDKKYVNRAWAELDAARQFKDWNPSHFLDTAEMTNAFALGYDWLFDQWTDEQKRQLQTAIVELGLKVGLEGYEADKPAWWTQAEHNWNQVCNGGLMMGALAIADVEPELAGRIVHHAVTRMPLAIRHYAPDGAWNEGPGYWAYATRYTTRPIAALNTALGTDFGLSDIAGLSEAGQFALHIVGPSGLSFNYADGGSSWGGSSDMWWLGKRYNQPAFAASQRTYAMNKPEALDILWGDFDTEFKTTATPTDRYFRDAEFATFRTAWNDRNALFVGLKSGSNNVNHSNLDLGSFVLDAHGQRFITDLGPDNYNLPDYFGKARWTYYRLRAEGHNTVVIGPDDQPDQDPKAGAKIDKFASSDTHSFAITDLTSVYAKSQSVQRGVMIDKKNQRVILRDEIRTKSKSDIWWFAHTPAAIMLSDDARSATLTLNGKTISARIIQPQNATFTIRAASPLPRSPNPAGQNANQGISKLTIHLPEVKSTTIVVVFESDNVDANQVRVMIDTPLSQWK